VAEKKYVCTKLPIFAMLRDLRLFFRLSRPLNVLIAAVSFGVSCAIARFSPSHFWQEPIFWAALASIVFAAASGYWINDVYDFRIDRINKPHKALINAHISVKKAVTVYVIVTICLLAGSYLAFVQLYDKPMLFLINAASVLSLGVYAAWLKRVSLVGNVLIACLTAMVILMGGYVFGFSVRLLWLAVFAFEATLLREITKDAEDIRGDVAFGLQTLPIQIGLRYTRYVLLLFYGIFLVSCWLPLVLGWLRGVPVTQAYSFSSLFLVQIPAIFLMHQVWHSTEPEDFTAQSRWLKALILTGTVSVVLM
jgi:4-hydroxybenzoate polyprenyltransferase